MFSSFAHDLAPKNPFGDFNEFKECLDEAAANMRSTMMPPAIQQSREWNPYVVMGGTAAAIAGPDFVVLGSDTRMSQYEVNIMTRECDKIHVLSDKIVLATCGFYGDILQLKRLMQWRLNHYKFTYQHEMGVDLFSTMLARTLYYRRFFPYYTGSILAGITDDGEGAVYSYDPIGMVQRTSCDCSGTGASILQSFFDIKIDECTIDKEKRGKKPMDLEQAKRLMRDGFRSVAERESQTGDAIKLVWLTKNDKQPKEETIPLRED